MKQARLTEHFMNDRVDRYLTIATIGIIPLGICSDAVSEDTDWITSISQDLILPLMIRTKSHSLP